MNPIVHDRNLVKDSIIVEEKAEAYQLKKAERLKENDIRIKAVRAKFRSAILLSTLHSRRL